MDESCKVAREFVRHLENDGQEKEHLPNQGFEFTKKSVNEELKRHRELLKSNFFKEICKTGLCQIDEGG